MLAASLALLTTAPATAAPAADTRSLRDLRAERAELLTRIAAVTDEATRAQERAARAADRRALAQWAEEEARRRVARFAVEAYVDAVEEPEVDQLRRKGWADVASATDRELLGVLASARSAAREETRDAERAAASARATTEELQRLRHELEQTIRNREAADRAAAPARRRANLAADLTASPRFARSSRAQAALFARYPFGPVGAIPAGLTATGQIVAGKASWYGPGFDGRPTASGAIYDQEAMTVAHRTLPLGTIVLISRGDRSVLALVNDRGPFVAGRVLDLSYGVAKLLGTVHAGVAHVTAQVLVEG